MKHTLSAVAGLGLAVRVAGQSPIQIPFSSNTVGPDGPWQVVEINVGTNQQPVSLIPGGWFESTILSSSVCNGIANCPASAAGTFNVNTSSPSVPPGSVNRPGFVDQWNSGPETNVTGTADLMVDQMTVGSSNQKISIPNFAMSLVESSTDTLPNGTKVPTSAGFLSLGGNTQTSQYQLTNGSTASGQMLPNFLAKNNQIPSASFGLHIGSLTYGQQSSLIFGGYDGSRAVGDVGQYDLGGFENGEPVVPMVDLTIGVLQGGTPFNTTNIGSLYRAAPNINASEPMSLNPAVPYMQMPLGVCEAIAEYLPVTFDSGSGLYLWNVNDPKFAKIVNSPAYMGIIFQRTGQPNLLIQVPFMVLNLTLTPPLAREPTQYFPCKPSHSPDDKFYLGRAFLQSAYLTVNWDKGMFTMSQAAGPDTGPSKIVPINPNDQTIQTSENQNFIRSWDAHWNIIPTGPQSGLGPGITAGIAAASISGVASLIGVVTYCIRRRNKKKAHNNRDSGPSLRSSPSNASSAAALLRYEAGYPATPLPGYPGPPGRQWYASGMKSVKEMEGTMPYYGSMKNGMAPYGRLPSYKEMPGGVRSYGYVELGQTQITELQARSVQDSSPDSPVEIHGREVGVVPYSLHPEDVRTPETGVKTPVKTPGTGISAVSTISGQRTPSSHSSSSSRHPPHAQVDRSSSDRPSITRNAKGFWEVSPVSPPNDNRI